MNKRNKWNDDTFYKWSSLGFDILPMPKFEDVQYYFSQENYTEARREVWVNLS